MKTALSILFKFDRLQAKPHSVKSVHVSISFKVYLILSMSLFTENLRILKILSVKLQCLKNYCITIQHIVHNSLRNFLHCLSKDFRALYKVLFPICNLVILIILLLIIQPKLNLKNGFFRVSIHASYTICSLHLSFLTVNMNFFRFIWSLCLFKYISRIPL